MIPTLITRYDGLIDSDQALATRVLTNAGSGAQGEVLDMFAWAVCQNPAITGASTDSDIQFTVNAVWSDLAGVHVLD